MMDYLKLCLGSLSAFIIAEEVVAQPVQRLKGSRPNIVVLTTDDQGYGDLSCNGRTSSPVVPLYCPIVVE